MAAGVRGDLSEGERARNFPDIRCAPASPPRGNRRTLGAEAARPRLGGDDPALPAPPRPIPGQSHQSGGIVVPRRDAATSPRASSSRCAARPAGARSRSGAAPATSAAPRRAGGLVEIRADRTRSAVPPRHRQDGRPQRLADKHVARLVKQTAMAAGARRSFGRRTGAEILRTFAARRPRLLRGNRRTLGAEAARPRLGGDDPALPAPPRPIPGQSHQSGGVVVPRRDAATFPRLVDDRDAQGRLSPNAVRDGPVLHGGGRGRR